MDTIVKNVNPKVCQLCCSRNKATPMYMNLDDENLSRQDICKNTSSLNQALEFYDDVVQNLWYVLASRTLFAKGLN